MEIIGFIANTKPYACWDWDLNQKNIEFLEGIDAEYFRYIAEAHAEHLEGENRHRAALALRISYSQALEALMALLCASVQAPNCVIGWMLSYNNSDLKNVVKKISNQKEVYTRLKGRPISWELIAQYIHSNLSFDQLKKEWIIKGFGKLWRKFANDFLDDKFSMEYNGAKHGLRTRPGGFSLAIGFQDAPNVPVSPDKMQSLGGSKYGTSYFTREKLVENDRINFRPRRQSRNWDPYNFINGLGLLSVSINNVISYLRILNKFDPKNCRFITPNDKDFADAPWMKSVGVINFDFDKVITPEKVKPVTKEEIFSSYMEQENTKI